MDSVRHHLNDQLLMAYAAGQLPEAFNLVVATHISLCDECRAQLHAHEAVGGAVLEAQESNSLSVDMEATLKKIAAGDQNSRRNQPIQINTQKSDIFPAALQKYVGGDADAVKWRSIGMGVKQAILKTSKSATVRLLYIPAGTAVPDHGHRGTELTLVLQGAFRDENSRFGRGDIEIATEEDEHTPVAENGMDCICLAATDAPLRFNGLLHRIAQPFLRI